MQSEREKTKPTCKELKAGNLYSYQVLNTMSILLQPMTHLNAFKIQGAIPTNNNYIVYWKLQNQQRHRTLVKF